MLDNETKRRIDTARNILVGKVPDPKSQVEQITIALIYKFMNDMDAVAEELGGSRTFFSGEFERYSWNNLMAPGMGGYDILNLYAEAIQKMDFNPNIPTLFHDIFKNAFLPYRDPQTLKMFLKVINDFSYDHSEKLGDAFEYLLSVLGSQGDAGQFRTPRHIIDFIVEAVNPQKNDTILDPACGTAGFLISAYKHILKTNTKKGKIGDALTPDDRTTLAENIRGYDISPDMVRLSLVNLYLHGFQTPNIFEYDTLTSQDRWNEYADVILANPPFMSPKGGIRPHKRFSVQSKRSEVLFVDYMCEHLTPNGKAGIIVPEGIIFQSSNAYKQLREMLVKNYLYAVISLPAGVFHPYSGVKTSILLLDKKLAKRTDKILFIKIENDGFNLGAQRRPIEKNDLPNAVELITDYKQQIAIGENPYIKNFENALIVGKEKITESSDWNLSSERYKESEVINTEWDLVELREILDYEQPTNYIVESTNYNNNYKTPVLTAGKSFILGYTNETEGILNDNLPVIIFDDFTTATKFVDFPFKVKSSAMKILHTKRDIANPKFVYHTMKNIVFPVTKHKRYWISQYSKIKIPFPPLEIQKEIVTEIEGYQKIIDGAKAVVENYKPQIQIDPEWEMVELGEIAEVTSSKRIYKNEYATEGIPFYRTKEIVELSNGKPISLVLYISKEKFEEIKNKFSVPQKNEILLSAVGTIGISWVIEDDRKFYFKDGNLLWIKNIKDVIPNYLKMGLDFTLEKELYKMIYGAAYKALTIVKLKRLKLPVPPLEIQKEIVARIEKEQELVNSNKELIKIFEQKIKDRIARVWGE